MILWHPLLILYNIMLIFLFIIHRRHVAFSVTLPGLPGPLHDVHSVHVTSHKRFAFIRFVGGGFREEKNYKNNKLSENH